MIDFFLFGCVLYYACLGRINMVYFSFAGIPFSSDKFICFAGLFFFLTRLF